MHFVWWIFKCCSFADIRNVIKERDFGERILLACHRGHTVHNAAFQNRLGCVDTCGSLYNFLNHAIPPNNIQKKISYCLPENTLHIHYKEQSVNTARGIIQISRDFSILTAALLDSLSPLRCYALLAGKYVPTSLRSAVALSVGSISARSAEGPSIC